MRKFIRHPSSIPIEFKINQKAGPVRRPLQNIGSGGLCFISNHPIAQGSTIQIQIPLVFHNSAQQAFEAEGCVAWCEMEGDHYRVGVQFDDHSAQFGVRMAEQVCHIEMYRAERAQEGRHLSAEEAAREWVERHAKQFPAI